MEAREIDALFQVVGDLRKTLQQYGKCQCPAAEAQKEITTNILKMVLIDTGLAAK